MAGVGEQAELEAAARAGGQAAARPRRARRRASGPGPRPAVRRRRRAGRGPRRRARAADAPPPSSRRTRRRRTRRPAGCGPGRRYPGPPRAGRARSRRVSLSGSWLGSPGRPSGSRGTKTGIKGSSSSCPSSARIRPMAVNSQPSPAPVSTGRMATRSAARPSYRRDRIRCSTARTSGCTGVRNAIPRWAGSRASAREKVAWNGAAGTPGYRLSSGPAAMVSRSPARVDAAPGLPDDGGDQRLVLVEVGQQPAGPLAGRGGAGLGLGFLAGPVPRSTSSAPLVARYSRTCSAARSRRASSSSSVRSSRSPSTTSPRPPMPSTSLLEPSWRVISASFSRSRCRISSSRVSSRYR